MEPVGEGLEDDLAGARGGLAGDLAGCLASPTQVCPLRFGDLTLNDPETETTCVLATTGKESAGEHGDHKRLLRAVNLAAVGGVGLIGHVGQRR
jgi:hypothetical protein